MSQEPQCEKKKKQCMPPQEIQEDLIGSPEEIAAYNLAILDDEFIFANTFIQQLGYLCEKLRTNMIRVKYRQIGKVFGVSRQKAQKCHMKYLRGEGIDGRPPSLTPEELEILKNQIIRLHQNSIYPSINQIHQFIYTNFHKNLYLDTIRHILKLKFQKFFKNITGVPMEDKRFDSKINEIEINLNQLARSINGIPIQFIFNLDEMGCSEFEDGRERTVIVPIDYKFSTAPYPISRSEKHSTCLACINPDGIFCAPQYAVQRSTVDSEVYKYISPEEIQIIHTETGYINSQSFTHWLYSKFLPALRSLRTKYSYNGPAILIMDGFSAHNLGIKNINLIQENLIVHYLVPHTSDQTQPLDLCIFGISKQFMSNYKYDESISRQSNQIIKIQNALSQAATRPHCRAAFRSIGIDTQVRFQNNVMKLFASFNLYKINKIRDYQISHIQQLVNLKLPLTPNQILIYNNYTRGLANNQDQSVRLPILDFSNQNKNRLVMPNIYIPKSNT